MCFSDTASFSAGGILILGGALVLGRTMTTGRSSGERLLASFPLLFGIQQLGEGVVWLGIEGQIPPATAQLGMAVFIAAAYVLWPVLGPVTGFLLEPPGPRRNAFLALIAGGVGIAGYLAYAALIAPQTPQAVDAWGGHIWYMHEFEYIPYIESLYFMTACSALLLSRHRTAFWFAVVLTVSFLLTMWGEHLYVLPSVWCFFAACASAIIVVGLWPRQRGGEAREGPPAMHPAE